MSFEHNSLGKHIVLTFVILAGGFGTIRARPGADVSLQASESVRFAVIGDFGNAGQAELDVANLVKNWNPDFIITTGDNNYPDGTAQTIDANIGQYYHEFIHPYTGSYGAGAVTNRFFPSLGNHDWNSGTVQPHLNYFTLPGNERYYDFVRGPVNFFAVDSDIHESDGITSASPQATWLKGRLAASTSPWNIVYMHHAPYSSGLHGPNTAVQWPYAAWGANVVLAGHDHTYERIFRDGISYFVNGLGGHSSIYPFGPQVAGSQVRYNSNHGAMLVDATTSELTLSFVSRTGSLIDSHTLSYENIDPSRLQVQPVTGGLSQPLLVTNASDNTDRLFIVERAGKIRILKNGALLTPPVLDMQSIVNSASTEQGLLALAFHPQFEANGYFYTVHTSSSGSLVLSRFTASPPDTDQVSFASRAQLLEIPHPTYTNHNGSTLAFGPDGYLYWSTGDGGGGGDPFGNAQNLGSLLGKILRLDVDSAFPYAIPGMNPFYNDPNPAVRKEIWAYGLRNPWRFSFDRLTHDIYIGDVGQNNIEEIDFQPAGSAGGENYGWPVLEGSQCYSPSSGCNLSGKVMPVAEYSHALGCSVSGGHVYRGSNYPSLYGHYFYGDFCSGRLFSLYKNPQFGWQQPVQLVDTSFRISTFGEDEQGELYLADYAAGTIYNVQYQEPFLTISGNVGVPGVELNYTDSVPQTANSLADGSYSFQVPASWSGTVTPAHACYTFDPPDRTYSNVTANQTSQNYVATFDPASGCANINVLVSGEILGNYGLPAGSGIRVGLAGVDNGPTQVVSSNGIPILSALRAIWQEPGLRTSYSEMMGLPTGQLSAEYWFPWYNNTDTASMDQGFRIANLDTVPHTIKVFVGASQIDSFTLGDRASIRVGYPINSGPVHILCDTCNPANADDRILVALRVIWQEPGLRTSYSEMMGLPTEQLSTEYWFPWYNNTDTASMSQGFRIANVDTTSSNTVEVWVGDTKLETITLDPGASTRVGYVANFGPARIVCTTCSSPSNDKIVASLRVIWKEPGFRTSYSEMMGLPTEQLSTEYWFPWYNNLATASMDQGFRIAHVNPTGLNTIKVMLGSTELDSIVLGTLATSTRVSYPVDDGPIHIVCTTCTGGEKIVVAMRVIWQEPGYRTSYSEMMGLPKEQLSSEYWFPWYNNASPSMDQGFRIAVP